MEKKLQRQLEIEQFKYPSADIEIWCMDEHRIGLHPILRKIWVSEMEAPIAKVQQKYKWLWVYGFVHPESGETYWWLMPQVNTKIFSLVLADVAKQFELNKNKRMLLVLDQAGWHQAGELKIPEGIDLLNLPPYSPEIQPAERLWPLLNEVIANKSVDNLEQLEDLLVYRCQRLMKERELIRGLTYYHWWPKTRELIYK